MTHKQKELIEKYLSAIDQSCEQAVMHDDLVEVVDVEYAKALIWDLMREYERMNSYPKVDFWGEPIS
jgi:hypothetical protein